MDPELFSAAATGTNLDSLTQFKVKIGYEITGSGNTLLHIASQFGQLKAVKRILSYNQELLLQRNEKGECALHLAASGGHSAVVRELINCAKEQPPGSGDIEEGGTNRVERLKDNIMKSESYRNGYTPLQEAVRSRHVDIVKMLIEEDPQYSYTPKYWKEMRETPLYLAARRGFDELVEVILQNCKLAAYSGPNGKTALHGAVISNSKRSAELLLNWRTGLAREKDSDHQTPLHFVDALINQEDYSGNTPLHLLCISIYSLPQLLLHPTADKGVSNSRKMTPLDLVTKCKGGTKGGQSGLQHRAKF